MEAEQFRSLASYKIIDHLYDDRKDFIILGMCGKVGSGVSTAARILGMTYEEMDMASPQYKESQKDLTADDEKERFDDHEDRIIHAYATKNWHPFHRIKTSALITRHILDYTVEDFCAFIKDLSDEESIKLNIQDQSDEESIESKIAKIAAAFFDREMEFCPEDFGFQDSPEEFDDRCKRLGIEVRYDDRQKCYFFRNHQLSKLMQRYGQYRRRKTDFDDIGFVLLTQYLYNFLPVAADELWKKVRRLSIGLPPLMLQCLGNNLRLNKKPYYKGEDQNTPLCQDGYVHIAEEINLTIKVLRAYQLVLRNQADRSSTGDCPIRKAPEIRTVIVIDSIKNPYESQYLKARYSNYYLIGIYTEDSERHRRLQKRDHISMEDIDAIDIIEDSARFKKVMKRYRAWLDGRDKKEYKIPKILRSMYSRFREFGLEDNLTYISPFVLQNVSSCLDNADILINNVRSSNLYTYLKKTLLRYVCLIMNPGLVLPTPVERCMAWRKNTLAYLWHLFKRNLGVILSVVYFFFLMRFGQLTPNPDFWKDLALSFVPILVSVITMLLFDRK